VAARDATAFLDRPAVKELVLHHPRYAEWLRSRSASEESTPRDMRAMRPYLSAGTTPATDTTQTSWPRTPIVPPSAAPRGPHLRAQPSIAPLTTSIVDERVKFHWGGRGAFGASR
jgi:hypothetical protein